MTPAGFFYAMKEFATAEHGGTHLDAPYHFFEGADLVGEIPLGRLIAPGVVVDVSAQAAADPDYRASADDIRDWEVEHGEIPSGTAVLFRTGWASRWPDALAYLGDDEPGTADNLHFPGLAEDAMRLLVERDVGSLESTPRVWTPGPPRISSSTRSGAPPGFPIWKMWGISPGFRLTVSC